MARDLAWRAYSKKFAMFIEVVPSAALEYELDKSAGYLNVDRHQEYPNIFPALYGFVPRTFRGERVAAFSTETGRLSRVGDTDPLDICVLTDSPIQYGNTLVECIPIGGFRMIDQGEADDKITSVLKHDLT